MKERTPYACRGWRKVRLFVLERDDYECRIRLPGCLGHADCVDHIVGWRYGGAWLDPNNLRASCTPCNTVAGVKARPRASGAPVKSAPPSREW